MVSKNDLAGRMRRFRLHMKVFDAGAMGEFLDKNLHRILEQQNTSLGFRDLRRDERDRILHNNFGKFPELSRYMDPAARKQYIKNTKKALKKMHRDASAEEEEKE